MSYDLYDDNVILKTDSYKHSHAPQFPPGTQNTYYYFESRLGAEHVESVFFGLQAFISKYLTGSRVDRDRIAFAQEFIDDHMGPGVFNRVGWEYIHQRYNGYLPVRIRAVPEGLRIPQSNIMFDVKATDPNCFWLPGHLEALLSKVWYTTAVCTISNAVRRIILDGLIKSGTPELIGFKLHDFGYRGVSSEESAEFGGMAHLVNFDGTDTIEGIMGAKRWYNNHGILKMCGFSIPAAEHSTITSWGKTREHLALKNLITAFPTGPVAGVSDSYDIDHACSYIWGEQLKGDVLARQGVVIVRPDSGNIVEMVLNVLNRLWDKFKGTVNSKGYRVLNDKVRVIQGDGCSLETIKLVVDIMIEQGWSIDNIAFGMGGGLLQKVNRDTQRNAYKCSAIEIDDVWYPVFKEPKSDPTKNSKRGQLALIKADNMYTTVGEMETLGVPNMLRTVFENGLVKNTQTFDEVRSRARA